jgi:ParB family chromosome partitioning protein
MDLHPEVKKLLSSKALEMGHARALLALDGAEQVAAAHKIARQGLSVRAAERLVKDIQNATEKKSAHTPDRDILNLQDDLTAKRGAQVAINQKKNGSGKLVISYSSLDQLDGIIEQLGRKVALLAGQD